MHKFGWGFCIITFYDQDHDCNDKCKYNDNEATQYNNDYKVYYWTLSEPQQNGWWLLTDDQRTRLYAMTPEQRVAAWTAIEAQMANRTPAVATVAPAIVVALFFGVLVTRGVDNWFSERVRTAVEKGRSTRPDIKLGICGEHGGDPASVHFCETVGLDYVSCSPYRVPIARLSAAQVALGNSGISVS